ncbi:MAG: bifunctional folylpolyglutamate synthase/dihydrofolate synthase, partial [Mariprofundaceae bacterium]
ILEAGVGARLDATTAVAADAALITPIALDHQAWLGDTLADIAAEKAHVTNGCRMALSAPQTPEVAAVIKHACPAIEFMPADAWQGPLHAPGAHQRINAGLAWLACQRLSEGLLPDIDHDSAHTAISRCSIPGRLQAIRIGAAQVWLDAAHNRHAIEALLASLPGLADPFDAIIVRSREDRCLADALDMLRPCTRTLIAGSAADDAWACLQQAIAERPDGRFLVLGSFTTVADIRQHL